jgi:Spy/CpxP family protein refolding chaperone
MNRIDLLTNRRAVLTALLTILLVGAAPALAQGPDFSADDPESAALKGDDDDDESFGPGSGRRFEHLARQLDLSDEQREAVAGIHESGRARDLPLRKQMLLLRHQMQGEMMKDSPSEKAVVALARDLGELRTKIQIGHLQDRLAMRELLTAGQRDKLLMMGENGHGFRRGGGGGPRGPIGQGAGCDGAGPGRDRPDGGPRGRAGRQGRNAN